MKRGSRYRKSSYPIDKLFLDRWSPRALSKDKITKKELMTLFEAARWAPSSYNNQPWRFVYAMKGSKEWKAFFALLLEGNQAWCRNAAALVILCSKQTSDHNGKPMMTSSFDTGAAWENLALQGAKMKLVVHGMQGFDYKKAAKLVKLPRDHKVEMMMAIAKPGKVKELPEKLQSMESPNGRKKLSEIVFKGKF